MYFSISIKTLPCIFWAGLHFVSEKTKDKILKHAQWNQQSGTRAFQPPKKLRENVFLLNWKPHANNSSTFEGKKISPEKVTEVSLALSHSFVHLQMCWLLWSSLVLLKLAQNQCHCDVSWWPLPCYLLGMTHFQWDQVEGCL